VASVGDDTGARASAMPPSCAARWVRKSAG